MEKVEIKEESEYSKLLKDQRWQKLRIVVLKRDNFTCKLCGKGKKDGVELNVHHIRYEHGCLPWEYRVRDLITLCRECHERYHKKYDKK